MPLLRSLEEEARLARPTLLRSSSSSDQSEMVGPKPEALPRPLPQTQASCRTPRPLADPSGPGLDWQLLQAHAQQTEAFQQFCRELVAVHQDVASSMHAVGQAMAELSSHVGRMSQTLTEIRDSLQEAQLGATTAAPMGPAPHTNAPPAPTRTTRSRKRKLHF